VARADTYLELPINRPQGGTEFESNKTYTNDHEQIPVDMSREPTSDSVSWIFTD